MRRMNAGGVGTDVGKSKTVVFFLVDSSRDQLRGIPSRFCQTVLPPYAARFVEQMNFRTLQGAWVDV